MPTSISVGFLRFPSETLGSIAEVLGPNLQPYWLRQEGVPLHAGSEMVFHLIGDCIGQVIGIDADTKLM